MLFLTLKKRWFDMEILGEKSDEYRELKPYWIKRFKNILKIPDYISDDEFIDLLKRQRMYLGNVLFKNGYSRNSPSFQSECTISVGTGKEEWGAEKDKEYFVLTINNAGNTR